MKKLTLKTFKRITAMSLAVCMIGTCTDWFSVAKAAGKEEDLASSEVAIEAEDYEEPVSVTKTEIKEERTKNSTTWKLSDGHKQVVYYSNDVRFENEEYSS